MKSNSASFKLICLASLVAMSCRSSHSSSPPPAIETPTSQKVDEKPTDKSKDSDGSKDSGSTLGNSRTPHEPPKPSEKDLCEKDQLKIWNGAACVAKVLDADTLFDPAFHCVRRISGAYSECQPIPRDGINPIVVAVASVTDTSVDFIKGLTFTSKLTYSFGCAGALKEAYLKLGTTKLPLVKGEETVSQLIENSVSFPFAARYELFMVTESFDTLSSACRIKILSNQTVLSETNRGLLRDEYSRRKNVEIKLWAEKELERIKDSDPSYSEYLMSFK